MTHPPFSTRRQEKESEGKRESISSVKEREDYQVQDQIVVIEIIAFYTELVFKKEDITASSIKMHRSVFRTMFLVIFMTTALITSAFVATPPKLLPLVSPSTSSLSSPKTTQLYQERRQPWNVFRSFQQSSKFLSLPFLPSSSPSQTQTIQSGQVIWQPSSSSSSSSKNQGGQQLFQWAPLDDVVMGGVSYSTIDNGSGRWKGLVTDANNGGFVGIRSTPNAKLDFSACRGLEWKFQVSANMPRRVKVVLRDSTDFNGIAWTISVDIPKPSSSNTNTVVTVKVPLNDKSLVPTRFAQIVKDEKDKGLDKMSITALQLVYSKFEYEGALNPKFQVGDFELRLLEVKAY